MTSKKSPYVFDVDEAGFEAQVLETSNEGIVLVDFWAEWCAPCLSLGPALEKVVGEYEGAVRLAKVEVDDNMKLAGHYRLRGFPTVIMFHRRQELGRFSSTHPVHWLRNWIDEHAGEVLL